MENTPTGWEMNEIWVSLIMHIAEPRCHIWTNASRINFIQIHNGKINLKALQFSFQSYKVLLCMVWMSIWNREIRSIQVIRLQRSGIDTIKYHTWPRIPMGKWQTHRRHHKREPRGQPFPSRWPQSTYKPGSKLTSICGVDIMVIMQSYLKVNGNYRS